MLKSRAAAIVLSAIVGAVALGTYLSRGHLTTTSTTLTVPFPFGVLKKDKSLLDPRNLATTWEYYLLENLAVGLLRDDLADAREYAPGLATAWSQTSPTTWTFEIRRDLHWSDGSPMRVAEMAAFYRRLQGAPSRHISHLRLLESVEADDARGLLHFRFRSPVGRGVLHELSLADAVYLHPSNEVNGWRTGSGPYVVHSYDPNAMSLVLVRNPHAVAIFGSDGPERVELFWTKDADFSRFFTERKADIFTSGAFSYRKKVLALDELPIDRQPGHPTAIYYLEVDPAVAPGDDPSFRRAFAAFVQDFFKSTKLPAVLGFENQLIPRGFHGRLDSTDGLLTASGIGILKGADLAIGLFPQMEELRPTFDQLTVAAAKAGFRLRCDFGANGERPSFARAEVFKGNQRDASGTWSFLLSTPTGPLRTLRATVQSDLDGMLTAANDDIRAEKSAAIHRKILESGLVVPFMNEIAPVYKAKRVDLSRWNAFDMRLRFYDVRWN
jgi:hypothetical protein